MGIRIEKSIPLNKHYIPYINIFILFDNEKQLNTFDIEKDYDGLYMEYSFIRYYSDYDYDERDRQEYSCYKWAYRENIFNYKQYDTDELEEEYQSFVGDNLLIMAEVHNFILSQINNIVDEYKRIYNSVKQTDKTIKRVKI